MANYRCEDCGLDMMEEDTGQTESCPRCGKDMQRTDGVILKNFGGSGVSRMGRDKK
ncbi:MAG TPA: hypothetical protein VHJ78_09625 [Actinomycetota bacterium]|nr:hypothetical protein [Actinomycetota bacterium]